MTRASCLTIRQATATKCSPATGSGNRSSSRASRRKRLAQANARSTTHRHGSSTTPRFAPSNRTTTRSMPFAAAGSAGTAPVALCTADEASSKNPALGLRGDRLPRRQLVGETAPRRHGADHPAEGVDDLARTVGELGRFGVHQSETGGDERPLLVGHIGRPRLAGCFLHTPNVPRSYQALGNCACSTTGVNGWMTTWAASTVTVLLKSSGIRHGRR